MRTAICIGHSRAGDNGAISVTGVSEWDFNQRLGSGLVHAAREAGMDFILYDNYEGNSYGDAMDWLSGALAADNVDAAIELHFNSASPDAEGYEYLYWGTSEKGHRLAECMLKAHATSFATRANRGVKPRYSGDRGAGFLSQTHCPSVICEPFFGSNNNEWEIYSERADDLALVYFSAIEEFARGPA